MMLHTKYQGSRICGFRQEDFFHISPNKSLCQTFDPRGRTILAQRLYFEQTW